SIRWNIDLQRQLTRSLVFELGYTGNHAVHLPIDQQLDFLPERYLSTSLARAFPHFTGINNQARNDGSSYFHGLSARLEKRFSHGIQFLTNYQFSRTIEKRNRLNDFSGPEKRAADIDRPHRFVGSGSFELPFGKGKALAGNAGPVVDRIIGGWIVNGIYSYEIGAPTGDWPGTLIYFGGPLNWNARGVDGAFDITRFNRNSNQQLSNNVRTFPTKFASLRGDSGKNVDCSILKNTRIKERVMLQFRAEFLNAFNHAAFSGPQLTPTNSNFGTITGVVNLERHIQMALRLTF